MVYIDAVHYEIDNRGNRFIAKLKWTNNLNEQATNICTKQQLINFIYNNSNCTKTKFWGKKSVWVNYHWIVGEDIRVVDGSFLRTDSNNIKVDNLGELPEF